MMTDEEFLRIAGYVKQRYGIDLGKKKIIMNGRLENYIKMGGWSSFHAFMNDLQNDYTGQLESDMVNLLTTNHTYFMREFEHFEFLKREILPWLKEKEQNTKDLRIWSAAASTGEEPYMIAMVLRDFFGLEHEAWDTTVLATDISTRALQQAIDGRYSEEQLKNLPEHWKRYFFQRTKEGMFQVTDELKQEVLFRQFNLMSPFPFRKRLHTIFLRNVMIYFDGDTKRQLLQKVYDFLEPGGYLFIGMTETLDRAQTPFEMIQPSIFRKKGGIN
ncbi:MAG: protein-glutamate O-methyltransferase CheR [Lachnospiraceae bacterium]|nr:protein-glutamate O-methyltransferase CheR [Lachnospiraceae bacterium]